MNMSAPFTTPATVFQPDGVVTLADVRGAAEAALTGTERRDVLSAFSVLVKRLNIDLETIPATAPSIRRLFERNAPAEIGLTAGRYANIRSLVTRAVDRFGMRRSQLTRKVPLSPEWAALLQSAEPKPYDKGIKRLAHYCSALGISPHDVRSDTLLGLHEALEAESLTKNPRAIIKHTIAMWNFFCRRIETWPAIILASPFRGEFDTFPLEHFPEGFRADVARWVDRMKHGDPLDPEAPLRPLRPSTIDGYVVTFRRFASALVRRRVLTVEAITSLAVFFEGNNFKEGLRHFLRPGETNGDMDTRTAHRIARHLKNVARHHVQVCADAQTEIELTCRRLDPRLPRTMGQRNRDRLEQFDEPDNVARLLRFPEEEATRAMRLANPSRRARGMERALVVALLIDTGLRIGNLRHIRYDMDLRRVAGKVHLTVHGRNVKNRQALTFELAEDTARLLDSFMQHHRPQLPGHEGPYVFPGKGGGPKSDNAMRAAATEALKKHTGLTMSPHLFRHATAKIIVERDPSMYVAVSRHLGHRSMATTLGSYLGTETRAAGRQLNRLLREARDNPAAGES